MRPRRGILRCRDREAPDQNRPRARVRDQRARAVPLRRMHASDVSVSQAGWPPLKRGNPADTFFCSFLASQYISAGLGTLVMLAPVEVGKAESNQPQRREIRQ